MVDLMILAEGLVVKDKFMSHKMWVSSVQWYPNSNVFISGSHDGSIKMWDVRSKIPLSTLPAQHEGKVLCLAWDNDNIVSGGADKVIKIHAATLPQTSLGL